MKITAQIAHDWAVRCFGWAHVNDKRVRSLRTAEEAIELAQSVGVPKATVIDLVNVVYDRPVGELARELGSVLLTAHVMAVAQGMNPEELFERELRRVLSQSPEHFTQRNQEKNDLGFSGSSYDSTKDPYFEPNQKGTIDADDLHVVLGTKYPVKDVIRLAAGLKRHVKQPYRFLCITDNEDVLGGVLYQHDITTTILKDPGLSQMKGCFCRLRMFDSVWQKDIGVDDRLVCLDLDVVVTRELDPLFDHSEDFVILGGANAANPCPFNGSIMMLRAGANEHVWDDFTLEKAKAVPFYEFPDDQGWIWHKLPNATTWQVGAQSGIYAFQKPGWPKGTNDLPADARLVVFPGWRSPRQFKDKVPWIKQHWHC